MFKDQFLFALCIFLCDIKPSTWAFGIVASGGIVSTIQDLLKLMVNRLILQWTRPADYLTIASYSLIIPGAIYTTLCTLLSLSPRLQREFMYLHRLRLPFTTYWLPLSEMGMVNLNDLSSFRLEHFSRNVEIRTSDGETLKAWHVAPAHFGPMLARTDSLIERNKVLDDALADKTSPVILYMHGQGGTRGMFNRVELVKALAAQAQAHVLVLDYRGFGGSSGAPSQEGLILDAFAAWQWLCELKCPGAFIYGQSLGAAVSTQLAASLASAAAGGTYRSCKLLGLVLDAPFFSAKAAAFKHPLYSVLRWIKPVSNALARTIADTWESGVAITNVSCPVLLFGAGRDKIIGKEGALDLADALQANRNNVHHDLIIVERATHSNIYSSNEWLVAVTGFLRK